MRENTEPTKAARNLCRLRDFTQTVLLKLNELESKPQRESALGWRPVQRGPFILSELISRYQTYKKLDGSYENISYLVKSEQP